MKKTFCVALVAVVVCSMSGIALAGRTTIELGSTDVTVREAADSSHGDYFLMDVNVPSGISKGQLLGAILEFCIDVGASGDSVLVEERDTTYTVMRWNAVPLIQVYALTSTASASLDSTQFDEAMSFPVPISMGDNKIAKIDITRLVKYYMDNPDKNHGIVIGSLTGKRRGLFTLQQGFGQGVFARIRYMY